MAGVEDALSLFAGISFRAFDERAGIIFSADSTTAVRGANDVSSLRVTTATGRIASLEKTYFIAWALRIIGTGRNELFAGAIGTKSAYTDHTHRLAVLWRSAGRRHTFPCF